jgi:fatty acid synthase subunit beta
VHVKGFVQKDCAFTGHPFGEHSALASIADVLHISALVDVVFYRGIAMQRAVECDLENHSNYAMCAVNPSRVSTTFGDAALCGVVDSIATRAASKSLLGIVNYNIEVSLTVFTAIHLNFTGSTICLPENSSLFHHDYSWLRLSVLKK